MENLKMKEVNHYVIVPFIEKIEHISKTKGSH